MLSAGVAALAPPAITAAYAAANADGRATLSAHQGAPTRDCTFCHREEPAGVWIALTPAAARLACRWRNNFRPASPPMPFTPSASEPLCLGQLRQHEGMPPLEQTGCPGWSSFVAMPTRVARCLARSVLTERRSCEQPHADLPWRGGVGCPAATLRTVIGNRPSRQESKKNERFSVLFLSERLPNEGDKPCIIFQRSFASDGHFHLNGGSVVAVLPHKWNAAASYPNVGRSLAFDSCILANSNSPLWGLSIPYGFTIFAAAGLELTKGLFQ